MEDVVDIEDLSAAWLGHVLDTEVRSVGVEQVGTGQTGATYRLTVDADELPETIIAKVAAGDDEARGLVAPGYRNEVGFYAELLDTLDVNAPHCRYAAISEDALRFTLLLEDLAPRLPGVQEEGCEPARATAAARNLAGLHAPRWNDATLHDIEWVSGPSAEGADLLGEVAGSAAEIFVERYGDELTDEEIATLRRAAEAMRDWLLARPEPFSVIHGDYRLDNLMFGESADDVVAVDWQTLAIGPPTRDLAYFLGTSVHTESRRAIEAQVVEHYHSELVARGVEGYSATACSEDYRLGQLQGPMITTLGAAYATKVRTDEADRMFLAMARRSTAAIRDLGSLDLL